MRAKYIIYVLILLLFGCSKLTLDSQPETANDTPIIEETSALNFIETLPETIQNQILWFSDYEDQSFTKWEDEGTSGEFSGGGIFNTDDSNIEFGIVSEIKNSGTYSSFATIKKVNEPGNRKAIRFMRWTDKAWNNDGDYFPDEAYYSAFFYFPQNYNPTKPIGNDPFNDGGWWNVFQFKSENNAGSHAIASLDLHNVNNKMQVGLIIKDYPIDDSDQHVQEYITQLSPKEIAPKEWVHFEIFYKKSKSYDGEIKVWQNGELIFDQNGVRTLLPQGETAVWGLNNYTDYIIGADGKNESTIYFDDAMVSSKRISTYLK